MRRISMALGLLAGCAMDAASAERDGVLGSGGAIDVYTLHAQTRLPPDQWDAHDVVRVEWRDSRVSAVYGLGLHVDLGTSTADEMYRAVFPAPEGSSRSWTPGQPSSTFLDFGGALHERVWVDGCDEHECAIRFERTGVLDRGGRQTEIVERGTGTWDLAAERYSEMELVTESRDEARTRVTTLRLRYDAAQSAEAVERELHLRAIADEASFGYDDWLASNAGEAEVRRVVRSAAFDLDEMLEAFGWPCHYSPPELRFWARVDPATAWDEALRLPASAGRSFVIGNLDPMALSDVDAQRLLALSRADDDLGIEIASISHPFFRADQERLAVSEDAFVADRASATLRRREPLDLATLEERFESDPFSAGDDIRSYLEDGGDFGELLSRLARVLEETNEPGTLLTHLQVSYALVELTAHRVDDAEWPAFVAVHRGASRRELAVRALTSEAGNRVQALEILGEQSPEGIAGEVADLLDDRDAHVRLAAALALYRWDDDRGLPAFIQLLWENPPDIAGPGFAFLLGAEARTTFGFEGWRDEEERAAAIGRIEEWARRR